jgi:tRNA-dihydrouridine synthase
MTLQGSGDGRGAGADRVAAVRSPHSDDSRGGPARPKAAGAFLIDINMGCPVCKIARKGGGSDLIQTPELAYRIVETVAAAVSIPVTVKTRLGWSEREAGSAAAVHWCRQLERAGAQLLTMHGGSRSQGFKGAADWQAIAAVQEAQTIPVIANGDVNSPEDARRCLAITGPPPVMVGRGSMGAPWLVGQIDAALCGRPIPATPAGAERPARGPPSAAGPRRPPQPGPAKIPQAHKWH